VTALEAEIAGNDYTTPAQREKFRRIAALAFEAAVSALEQRRAREVKGVAHHAGRWQAAYEYHLSRQAVISECVDDVRALAAELGTE
jgi:hypothetical protein